MTKLTNFVGNITQRMFHYMWKFKPNTSTINYFMIKYKVHGMVIRRSRRSVSWRSATSLFYNAFKYFWLGTQKSTDNLNNLSYMNIISDDLLSNIDNVLQKGEFNLTVSA